MVRFSDYQIICTFTLTFETIKNAIRCFKGICLNNYRLLRYTQNIHVRFWVLWLR